MRFFLITILIALAHVVVSVVLFTVALAGIGAMTASEAQSSNAAWSAFAIWNFAPITVSRYEIHAHKSSAKVPGSPDWTQADQVEQWRENQYQSQVRDLLFSLWPFVLGLAAACTDKLFRLRKRWRRS